MLERNIISLSVKTVNDGTGDSLFTKLTLPYLNRSKDLPQEEREKIIFLKIISVNWPF